MFTLSISGDPLSTVKCPPFRGEIRFTSCRVGGDTDKESHRVDWSRIVADATAYLQTPLSLITTAAIVHLSPYILGVVVSVFNRFS